MMQENIHNEENEVDKYLSNEIIESYTIDKFGVVSKASKKENNRRINNCKIADF